MQPPLKHVFGVKVREVLSLPAYSFSCLAGLVIQEMKGNYLRVRSEEYQLIPNSTSLEIERPVTKMIDENIYQ